MANLNNKTHSEEKLKWITDALKNIGVAEFRLCVENDCYACDRFGNFYSV